MTVIPPVYPKKPYDVRADVPGAAPQLRFTLGFERGFAGCLESQMTLRNAAIAAAAARFRAVAAALLVMTAPGVIDGILHPPGTSINPNPYLNGQEQGSRLCAWALKISPVVIARSPVGGAGAAAAVKLPTFEELIANPAWLERINPEGCTRNCGVAAVRVVDALFGKGIQPAPATKKGMTDGQMEAIFGGKFSNPMTDVELYQLIESLPEGSVGIVSAENPNFAGTVKPTGKFNDWNEVPGHFFAGVKAKQPKFLDGQAGGEQTALPGDWWYRWMKVGDAK